MTRAFTTTAVATRNIRATSLFTDYRIQSNAGNQITVSLSSEALLNALRSPAGQR